jgi:hypothetical protein
MMTRDYFIFERTQKKLVESVRINNDPIPGPAHGVTYTDAYEKAVGFGDIMNAYALCSFLSLMTRKERVFVVVDAAEAMNACNRDR